jgi:hypothetical protein
MKERDDSRPIEGMIQVDDAYWGGERRGGKRGRGAAGKSPFVAAVPINQQGHPIAMRLTKAKGFRSEDMIPRLGYVAMKTLPMPYRLLKLAEVWG